MHAALNNNAKCFRLGKLGPASMNNKELANAVGLKIRRRGDPSGYEMADAFFYDSDGNLAMIRVSREIVACAHLYQRVHEALRELGAESWELPEELVLSG